MSYCRWSSDLFQCDVYVYEDVSGGWTTHVAGNRPKPPPKEIEDMPSETFAGILNQHAAVMDWMRETEDEERIDLSKISNFAGKTFNDPTPGDCADRLEEIRASGLNVPQYAIDTLREEEENSKSDNIPS